MLSPVFAQETKVVPSDKGTLNVGLTVIPLKPTPTDETKVKIDFINPKNDKIQEHIDYTFTLLRGNDQKNVFGPTPLIHTSEGSVTIPVGNLEEGTYLAEVEFEGILFQPIDPEIATFTILIGDAQGSGNGISPT